MKSRIIMLLVVAMVLGVPSVAWANAGTPLMWATIIHMFAGNLLIGMLEGALLAGIFRVPAGRAIVLMILANYVSAWVGWLLLTELLHRRNDIDLYNAARVIWGMIAAAYAATILLEWPFVAGCFWRAGHWFRRSWIASLLIQTVSYVLLFGWYGLASVNSILTETALVPLEQIALPADVRVYYIAAEDGDVYTRQLGTGTVEKVFDLNSTDPVDCLSFEEVESKTGFRELVALLDSHDFNNPKIVRLGVLVANENCPVGESHRPMMRYRFPSPGRSTAEKLGAASDSPWSFKSGFWPADGLRGENAGTGAEIRVALEAPFLQWEVRHAIVLPEDRVLFQLGKRQTCILDPETKKVAVLCYGRGAVAVLEKSPQDSSNATSTTNR